MARRTSRPLRTCGPNATRYAPYCHVPNTLLKPPCAYPSCAGTWHLVLQTVQHEWQSRGLLSGRLHM